MVKWNMVTRIGNLSRPVETGAGMVGGVVPNANLNNDIPFHLLVNNGSDKNNKLGTPDGMKLGILIGAPVLIAGVIGAVYFIGNFVP